MIALVVLAVAVAAYLFGYWHRGLVVEDQSRRDAASMARHASLQRLPSAHWPPSSDSEDGRAGLNALGDLRQERDEATS